MKPSLRYLLFFSFSENLENATFLEKNFHVTIHNLNTLHPHYSFLCHPGIMFICYMIPKISTFAIIYGDILCIVLSYKISAKLHHIIYHLEGQLQLNVISRTTKSKHIAEMASIRTNYDSKIPSWQTVYNEISDIRKLTIETSKFLSPVLLISLMVYMFTLVHNVSFLDWTIDTFKKHPIETCWSSYKL